jgi:hypothetical protein
MLNAMYPLLSGYGRKRCRVKIQVYVYQVVVRQKDVGLSEYINQIFILLLKPETR